MNDLPVTREWLYSIGFEDDSFGCPTLGALHVNPVREEGVYDYPPYACIRTLPIPVPQTRGDLLTLCRLIGLGGFVAV